MKIDDEELGARWIQRLSDAPYFIGGILSGLALFGLYILMAHWSYYFVMLPLSSGVFWLPSGFTTALIIRGRWQPQLWPFWLAALFFGEFFVATHHSIPTETAVLWSLANIVLPLIIGLIARKFVTSPFDFRSVRDVMVFSGIILVAVIPGSFLGGLGKVISYPGSNLLSAMITWGGSDAIGIILLAPLLLCLSSKCPPFTGSSEEGIVLTVVLFVFSFSVFFASTNHILHRSYFSFLIIFVGWAAVRFGPKGTSIALLFFDLVEVWATIKGQGPFANLDLDPSERLFTLQLLVANIGLLMLLLAAAIEDQRSARVKAEVALKTRDDFLSIASHELKTPLSSLMLQVQMINRYIAKGDMDPGKLGNLAKVSELQMRRYSHLINDLLDVTRINAKKLSLNLEDIDLNDLIRHIVDVFSLEIESSSSSTRLKLESVIKYRGDRYRLEQVITNLLSNALKYGRGRPIEITAISNDKTAIIVVRDYGVGISKEDQKRIFDRFERASALEQIGGLGLGLFITRQIVEAHGGTIRVESEVGEGSSFIVELPV